jgi:uncharacterized protein (TIGR02145 family)
MKKLIILFLFTTYLFSQDTTGTVTDIDGNVYSWRKIGAQYWMTSDLRTTHYNDGTDITNVTVDATWAALTTEAYCWYSNNYATYGSVYGALYNWYAVNTGKLAPTGWTVATDTAWTALTTYLGGESVAGDKLKSITGWATNTGTNEVGFTALPGGYRSFNDGSFYNVGGNGYWWSSTEYSTDLAWSRFMYYDKGNVYRGIYSKNYGFSVRCIRYTVPTPQTTKNKFLFQEQ